MSRIMNKHPTRTRGPVVIRKKRFHDQLEYIIHLELILTEDGITT